ncbi:hypothetical protein D5R81_20310 [Parashewanella spongiae]|uniref:Uncharacterized protein n=1 Tax=Parashewanella spongiae TaxID=342950 RepID=A0A3A6SW46_9GAMM|nr:hypothetical protein [Parashewanella spongiae]MCL1080379.1 hypothetical protein [Parashewanella spongiae]RJX99813.1 hypothetical protein D5R81_20310 [Parashewanella spongiae]
MFDFKAKIFPVCIESLGRNVIRIFRATVVNNEGRAEIKIEDVTNRVYKKNEAIKLTICTMQLESF